MGEQYRQSIEAKINDLGAQNLRAIIIPEGVDPHYRRHLEEIFLEAGVQFVSTREEANLVLEGNRSTERRPGQVVAIIRESHLIFAGILGEFRT